MSVFADREILTSSSTLAGMGIFLGCISQFTHRAEPQYCLGYGLAGASVALLLITLLASRNRRILALLRYLMGAILVALLLGILVGFDRIGQALPHGQFV